MFKIFLILLLALSGAYMILLGIKAGIQPPVITGVGFFIIALLFLMQKNR